MAGRIAAKTQQNNDARAAAVKQAAARAERKVQAFRTRYAVESKVESLNSLCQTLFQIAQKYIPAHVSAFQDTDALVNCAKLMEGLGIAVVHDSKLAARLSAADFNVTVVNSEPYRTLKYKAIAGLATVADLTEKSAAVGNAEYQSGVREGYRRASDIAIMFLDDIQNGAE